MESTLVEIRFKQTTKEDPHAATWEDGQWSKAGRDTWGTTRNMSTSDLLSVTLEELVIDL